MKIIWEFLSGSSLRVRQEKCIQMRAESGEVQKNFLSDHFDSPESKGCADALAEKFQAEKLISFPGYIPHPQDNLSDIYVLEGDDLDDMAEALLQTLQCRMPTAEDFDGASEVHTVGDFVNWLAYLRSDPDLRK